MHLRYVRDLEAFAYSVPFHPFLFATYPVLLLYADNLNEVQAADVAGPLFIVLGIASIGYLLLARLTHRAQAAAVISTTLIVVVLGFGRISDLVEAVWVGNPRGLALVAVAVVVAISSAAYRWRTRLGTVTAALNLVSVILLALVLLPIGSFTFDEWGRPHAVPAPAEALALPADARAGRDIYHLVFDRYGSEAAYDAGFGLDNADFIAWLREEGFVVIDDARANYVRTTMSLASVLGMGLLDDVVERVGSEGGSYGPLVDRIQSNPAASMLQELGYEYVHIGSWFADSRGSRIADRVFAAGRSETFLTALSDLSIVPIILEGRTYPGPSHARSALFQFDVLADLASEPGPKYVFAHVLLPHPPFVFLADGTVDGAEASLESQLAYTNERIRMLLGPLLALPEDEQPIIILQADEGPYPQRLADDRDGFQWADATDEELLTKFGVLNAFLLPGPEGAEPLPASLTLVNTFPEVFRRYFGLQDAAEPDRSYTSQAGAPYTLADITERLDRMGPTPVDGSDDEGVTPSG